MKTVLVSGAAGFIGFHLIKLLHDQSEVRVVGIDNLNDYYDVQLKLDRLEQLKRYSSFEFENLDISNRDGMRVLFERHRFDRVIHLAAQAGVRYSIENPHAYVDSNLIGMTNILEGCRHQKVPHLVYASSSSVYGLNTEQPFSVHQNVDHPISLYAATKKSNELLAHCYSYLYGLPTTGLRFFTVYGPWGRPDMALFKFTDSTLKGKPIDVFNNGNMRRDFTYIDDIVKGVAAVTDHIATPNPNWDSGHPDPATSSAPYRIYNIGNHNPVSLMDFIEAIEQAVGRSAVKKYLPMQPGDVLSTFADVDDLQEAVGFSPSTPITHGIKEFVAWYRDYYKVAD
jgi:UDP-glucuronate 4-epimerase